MAGISDLMIEQVRQVSAVIAAQETQGWERFGVNTQDYQGTIDDLSPLSLTAIYRLTGQAHSKLHKEHFRSPSFPTDTLVSLEGAFADRFTQESVSLSYDGIRSFVKCVDSALEETKTSNDRQPFGIVAMLGIYNTNGNTIYAYTFAPTNILDAIAKRLPEPALTSEVPDSILKDMYATESEQSAIIEPFEEWKQLVQSALSRPQEEISHHSMAETTLRPLLMPSDYTHPTVQSTFFA